MAIESAATSRWSHLILPTIVAVLMRTVAFVYFGDHLEDNFAFVAPWNSFQRLRDGVALWRNGAGLYAGEFHSVPWVALLFSPLVNHQVATFVVFTAIDLITGILHYSFAFEYLKRKHARPDYYASFAYIIYVLNPMSIGVCAVLSLSTFLNLLLAAALLTNLKGRCLLATILVSLAAQLNPYYVVLLVATVHVRPLGEDTKAKASEQSTADHSVVSILLRFALAFALYAANWMFVEVDEVFRGNFMFFMKVEDQTPNVGMFWYMFTQVFAHYRLFFLCVFQIVAFLFVFPLWQLLKNSPFVLWFAYLQIVSIISSYPTYAEFSAHLPLFFAFVHLHQYYKTTYAIGIALVVAMCTSVITLTQWLQTGSGNANFYFGSCSTYILALMGLVRESIYAQIAYEHALEHPETDPKAHRYFHTTSPTELEAERDEHVKKD